MSVDSTQQITAVIWNIPWWPLDPDRKCIGSDVYIAITDQTLLGVSPNTVFSSVFFVSLIIHQLTIIVCVHLLLLLGSSLWKKNTIRKRNVLIIVLCMKGSFSFFHKVWDQNLSFSTHFDPLQEMPDVYTHVFKSVKMRETQIRKIQ